MTGENLLVHYWQLPSEIYINLKRDIHKDLCKAIQEKLKDKHKNCFYRILNCPKWHAQRLFTNFTRITINELEILREFAGMDKGEIEKGIETIGCHEDGTIIKNPKLPFHLKDIVYVASHLMFDGSYRDKKGCYFYAYEPSLVEYHKKRINSFGEVPNNLINNENQFYFSYTIGYLATRLLDIRTLKSTKCSLSDKFKSLCKENKILTDEVIKALIIDEGNVDDKIEAELANEQLVRDIYEVASKYYNLTKVTNRTRTIDFKNNPKWTTTTRMWNIGISAFSFQELYKSISPLPISYKQENLEFLYKRQTRNFSQRKSGETKKLIVKSLLESPKTMEELAKEFLVKQTTILAHLKGHPTYTTSLLSLGLIGKISEKLLRRGGYAKVGVYGVIDIEKAKNYLDN